MNENAFDNVQPQHHTEREEGEQNHPLQAPKLAGSEGKKEGNVSCRDEIRIIFPAPY